METRVLKVLPSDVQSRLRSDVAITSVAQCVEELVLNSLDAGAVCIAVRLDLTTFTIQVVDNGTGISQDDLKLIGERYSTSKCQKLADLDNLEYFGYRGEAIASLRDISTAVEIHSRCRQSSMTYCKLYNHGKPVAVADSKYPRPCPGTTITVHNLFYNLPVRQKNIFPALELERTRYRIEGISLINPTISFSLRNDATGHILLQTQKSNSILTAFMYLFGGNLSKHLKHVAIDKEPFHIEGYIGKDGYNKKLLQFVYVNNRLILKTQVHKVINKIMTNCIHFRRKPWKDIKTSMTGTPPRCMEKHPMFVINIKCPLNIYDITFDPKKTLVEFKDWETLTSAVETMVTDFLKSENLWYGTESDMIKTGDSSSPIEPTTEQSDAQKNTEELKASNESEISTLNTSNSLFSKIVFRKPPEILEIKIPSPSMVEISTPNTGNDTDDKTPPPPKSSDSQEAVKEFANRLHIDFNPKRGDFASDDEVPIEEHVKKTIQYEATASWSDTSSSASSEDTLQEDPLPLNTSNKALLLPLLPPPKKMHDPNPTFISLPSESEFISTMDTLRSKDGMNGGNNLTAAQKISLRLKERSSIRLPEKETVSKVSRALQKFRKISRQKVVEICGSVGVLVSKSTNTKDAGDAGDALEAKADKPELPDLLNLNISNNNMTTQTQSNTRDPRLERKRTKSNQGLALIPNQSKKSKFMTSESFVMTPRTALVEVLPLLQRAQRQSKKTQITTSHEASSSVRNIPNHSSNQSPTVAFLDRTFKKPHPIDPSRHYNSSKFSPYGRSSGGQGPSKNSHTTRSERMEDVDTTEEHSEKFIDTSQGFDTRMCPSSSRNKTDQSGTTHILPESDQVSQGFSLNFSTPEFDSSRQLSCPETQEDFHTSAPADHTFPPTLPFEYSAEDSGKNSQLTPLSSSFNGKTSAILLTPPGLNNFTDHQMSISSGIDSKHITFPPSSSDNKISDILQTPHSPNSTSTQLDTDQSFLTGQLQLDSDDPSVTSPILFTMEDILPPRDNSTIDESQLNVPGTHILSVNNRNLEMYVDSITEESGVVQPCEVGNDVKDSEMDSSFQCGQKYNSTSDEKPYTDSYSITDLLSDSSQTVPDNPASCIVNASSDNHPTESGTQESNMAVQKDHLEREFCESNKTLDKDHLKRETCESNKTLDKDNLEHETCVSNKALDKDQFENETQKEQKMSKEENKDKDGATESGNGNTRDIWIEMTDKNSGKVIHVNQLTGNTVYEKEWTVLQQNLDKPGFSNSENILCSMKTSNISTLCTNDSNKLYSMLVNHLDTHQEEQTIKWRNRSNIDNDTGNSVIDDMFNQWNNPVHQKTNLCGINTEVNHSSRSAETSYQSLNQVTFTKDMLSCMQVLGQVDCKFIACLISSTTQSQNKALVPDLLVMLDQHAAHERVRLEQYISEIFEEDDDGSDRIKESEITPPLSLTLRQEDIRVITSFKNEFSRIGIKFTGVEENRNEIRINSIPSCIVEREANELKRGKNSIAARFVEELITEHVEYLKTTSGSRRRLPLALQRILATKACRGAIKFNDILSPAQCKELITALSKCDLPFQCAHGRPSVIPLFKLDSKLYQHTQVKPKPRLDKLMKGRLNQK